MISLWERGHHGPGRFSQDAELERDQAGGELGSGRWEGDTHDRGQNIHHGRQVMLDDPMTFWTELGECDDTWTSDATFRRPSCGR